ncbi:phosphate transport-domain-containing protein [Fimicolochytrium jonesii]|uniref:phosphate transport-domain-containing protein n=1 Tax=Fimicolochytrium jonesii TaxID=1396493 RepID=UPI0022FE77A8|nr:phosphate transport-domain-containing protein [Fimicolochytrium jonesii]KAI8816657.1 phosphate transport-domain-containing protein [Fimicolochytrium jonesii]
MFSAQDILALIGLYSVATNFESVTQPYTNLLWAAYLGIEFTSAITLFIVYRKIALKNDQAPVMLNEGDTTSQPNDGIIVRTTDYDSKNIMQHLRSLVIRAATFGFFYLKFGHLSVLLLQAILGLKTIYHSQVVQVHLLGKQSVGNLARPW